MNQRSRAVFIAVAAVIGLYYSWGARAANDGFAWKQDFDGYYDHLARGFASGHLYLPDEPAPELLALPNPWDPKVPDSLKMGDAVLYHRRYYLYHGAGPAVMLFLPWRLLTHHDLPENFGLFLFCFGGYLFSAGTLVGMLRSAELNVSSASLAFLLVALGTCQAVPFLLNRVWVYEVAIGAGYFCLSGGLFFCTRGKSGWPLAVAGLMFGLAIACRPHLGIAGVLTAIAIARSRPRRLLLFCSPFAMAGIAVGVYNYERFHNPLDFGNRYLLGGANQTEVKLSAANVPPGLFYMLAAPPVFGPVFPWVRLHAAYDIPRPGIYTVEPTAGALFLAPFFPLAFATLFKRRGWILVGSAVVILAFITGTGWSTQRYVVDFLPLLVLGALTVLGRARGVVWIPISLAIAFALVVNLALAISGPYDEMIRSRPARFVRIARWFSPIERYRPLLSPPLDVQFRAPSKELPPYYRQHLFTAGLYELWIENIAGQRALISELWGSRAERTLGKSDEDVSYRVRYVPGSEEVHVSGNGVALIDQKIGPLVAAPSEIVVRGSPY